jgi:hypothetical protein
MIVSSEPDGFGSIRYRWVPTGDRHPVKLSPDVYERVRVVCGLRLRRQGFNVLVTLGRVHAVGCLHGPLDVIETAAKAHGVSVVSVE